MKDGLWGQATGEAQSYVLANIRLIKGLIEALGANKIEIVTLKPLQRGVGR